MQPTRPCTAKRHSQFLSLPTSGSFFDWKAVVYPNYQNIGLDLSWAYLELVPKGRDMSSVYRRETQIKYGKVYNAHQNEQLPLLRLAHARQVKKIIFTLHSAAGSTARPNCSEKSAGDLEDIEDDFGTGWLTPNETWRPSHCLMKQQH